MFEELIRSKRCILVCGGGGVGKTTVSASLALSATRIRARVLVLTIDPSQEAAHGRQDGSPRIDRNHIQVQFQSYPTYRRRQVS
jgi:putative protein kinase ArgK-like GTPase of G3E family